MGNLMRLAICAVGMIVMFWFSSWKRRRTFWLGWTAGSAIMLVGLPCRNWQEVVGGFFILMLLGAITAHKDGPGLKIGGRVFTLIPDDRRK